ARDVVTDMDNDGEDEAAYWRPRLVDETAAASEFLGRPRLLPGFDEFILGYRDRTFAMTEDQHARLVPGNNGVFQRSVVIDGLVRGLWKRAGRPGRRALDLEEFAPLGASHRKHLEAQFARFPFAAA